MPKLSALPGRGLFFAALLLLNSPLFAAPDISMVPGSATMPAKPLKTPLPASLRGSQPVRVGAWVDETGKVIKADTIGHTPDPTHPAVQALLNWRFEPVLWEGKPIRFRVEVVFAKGTFTINPLPNFPGETHVLEEYDLVKPSLLVDPEVQIPLEEFVSRATVEAGFRFVVGTDGIPNEIEIIGASSGPALNAGLNALSGQVYRPGTIDGQPVRVSYKQIVSVNTTTPVPAELAGLQQATTPVFPYDLLLSGETGSARVKFTLNSNGNVKAVQILEASHENFGLSLKAAVSSWAFTAGSAALQPEREYTHEFASETIPGGMARLAKLLKKGEIISNSGAQLSGKPVRVASGALCFPPELIDQGLDGSAKIEFVIDRCGLAQVPRIIEASHPAFGWAAANWVSTLRFKPLQRAGAPADLRVIFPISFKNPKTAANSVTPPTPPATTPAS